MSICKHCGKDIVLKDGEKNCPNCGLPPYNCWNCGEEITGETKECKKCGFFTCPSCGVCGTNCPRFSDIQAIKGKSPEEIVDYFYNQQSGLERKDCPFGVPISYAKDKLRTMALKLKGYNTKNEKDTEAFKKRFEKIGNYPTGKEIIITYEKEEGTHGIELREACNLLVCQGYLKKQWVKKDGKEYEIFIRTNEVKPCPHSNWSNLIQKYCKKCKRTYPYYVDFCKECKYQTGEKKGQIMKLATRKSYTSFCQLPRIHFVDPKTLKEKKDGDEEETN